VREKKKKARKRKKAGRIGQWALPRSTWFILNKEEGKRKTSGLEYTKRRSKLRKGPPRFWDCANRREDTGHPSPEDCI